MTNAEPQKLSLLARLVVASILVLIVAGIVWYGVSIATFKRIWYQLIERADAPMRFRFILQPLMAEIAAILAGLKDVRTGRSPYFWTMLGNPRQRVERLEEGLNATARIILLGLVMDVIYQIIVLQAVLSGRGGYRRFAVRVYPVCDHPRACRADRALVARRCLSKPDLVRARHKSSAKGHRACQIHAALPSAGRFEVRVTAERAILLGFALA